MQGRSTLSFTKGRRSIYPQAGRLTIPLVCRAEMNTLLWVVHIGWWHHVTQRGDSPAYTRRSDRGERGVCIAVNWWYDMEMRGDRWVWLNALRKAGRAWGDSKTGPTGGQ